MVNQNVSNYLLKFKVPCGLKNFRKLFQKKKKSIDIWLIYDSTPPPPPQTKTKKYYLNF